MHAQVCRTGVTGLLQVMNSD